VDKKFQPQQAAITAQISGLQPGQNPNELQQQMADLLAKERVELEQMLQDPALRQFSDGWNLIYSKMEQVYSQQQKYNDELRKSADLMTPLADGLKSVSGLLDSIWSSKFVKGLSASLSGGIAALQGSQKAGTQIREALHPESTTVPKDPQMQALENAAKSAANTFGGVQTSADKLIDSLNSVTVAATATAAALSAKASGDSSISFDDNGNATTNATIGGTQQTKSMSGSSASGADSGSGKPSATERFTSGMIAATGEITNFADALHHSTSALGGAAGGAVGGAGIGNTISGALGAAGPFGAIAGAVVGGVMGAISGHKNAEMSSELSQMNSQYTSLMDAFHANTDNLQVTINELQNLMAEAAEEQANSKKGGQAFGSLISQYSEELSQLQDQQSSIISSLETQLAIFDTPTGMQQFLTNLDTIIQQYDKFAGAAENASQLAQANSWLTDSLSSYTAQMENTFVSDEEGGISDALQLNSLLSERSTMISQLGNSIQNVLEQGVLTRQQTGAQKKGQQIYQLESAASLQMTSINNEISLETYKVGIETSLYNLGMTSMALQGQLLVLQEAQASQSLASISALQTLMDTLNGGGYSGTLSSILTLLGYGTAAGNIPAGTTQSPYGPIGGTTIGGLDALVSAAYQSRATLGYAGYRGGNI
jgi:hypothetical protein